MRVLRFAAQDNFFVRGIRSMKHAMFSETEEGETLALIKKLDPTWDLHAMLMSTRRSSPLDSTDDEGHARKRLNELFLNLLHGRVLTTGC